VKNVDGFLVGGASLKPSFLDIVNSAKLKQWLINKRNEAWFKSKIFKYPILC
jgi:hypothetical protein